MRQRIVIWSVAAMTARSVALVIVPVRAWKTTWSVSPAWAGKRPS